MRDDRVTALREYMDTLHVLDSTRQDASGMMADRWLEKSLIEMPPQSGGPLDSSGGELLRRIALEAPDRAALIEHSVTARPRVWSYAELLRSAEEVARALLQSFQPGDNVATWAGGKAEMVLLQLGAALAGVTLVTLNPACRREELRFLLTQSESRGLFMDKVFRGLDNVAVINSLSGSLPALGMVVALDEWDAFIGRGRPCALPTVSATAPALICFTSGTTGQPKGVVLTHAATVNNASSAQARFGVRRGSVWLNLLPMFHIGGTVTNTLGCLSNAGTQVLLPEFDAEAMLGAIEQHHVQIFMAVPTMMIRAFQSERFAVTNVSSIEVICVGGATVSPELVRQIQEKIGCSVQVMFGQTEAGGCMTLTLRDDDIDRICNTVGIALGGSSMKIIYTSDGAVANIGAIGEICVRSPTVMAEYFRLPQVTAEAKDAEGWVHTGDLGRMRPDGYIQITGRLKDMIVRGGENIYPREIEEELMKSPLVSQVSVFGVPDEEWGEQVAAAIVPAVGLRVDEQALAAFLRDRIARHKIPKHWLQVSELPTNASGKVQKFVLQDRFRQERGRGMLGAP